MASKTFKIGERAVYGIWKATVTKTKVLIQGIDWDSKQVEESKTFEIPSKLVYASDIREDAVNKIMPYLEEKMDYSYAEKIMNYIRKSLGYEE